MNTVLQLCRARGMSHVFAASDRPTVIYSANNKLLFSNLNENEVSHIASFNASSFPDSLALVKPGSLSIGSMDDIQKLHVRTVPLHEQPRRITHQESSRSFLVTITQAMMGKFRFILFIWRAMLAVLLRLVNTSLLHFFFRNSRLQRFSAPVE